MTQEEKQLLLVDLSARLPYGVKVSKVVGDWTSEPHQIRSINLNNIIVEDGEFEDGTPDIDVLGYENIKPYLFPLSSMTEEQKEEYYDLCDSTLTEWGNPIWFDSVGSIDWLNKNHFDFRNLICRGLAIDCTNLNIY